MPLPQHDRWMRVSYLAILLVTCAAARFPQGWSDDIAAIPFLLSALAIGLPHGAADLSLSAARFHGGHLLSALRGFGSYTAAMAVSLALLIAFPLASLLAFGFLSAWHFGSHDRADLDRGHRMRTGPLWNLWVLHRGALVVFGPLAIHPHASARFIGAASEILGTSSPPAATSVQWLGLVCVGLSSAGPALALLASRLQSQTKGSSSISMKACFTEAIEFLLLVALVIVAHPAMAVGSYFLFWHSLRQIPLVSFQLAPDSRLSAAHQILRVHAAALPLWLPALITLGVVGYGLRIGADPLTWAALIVCAFAVVTPSHEFLTHLLSDAPHPSSQAFRLPAVNPRMLPPAHTAKALNHQP